MILILWMNNDNQYTIYAIYPEPRKHDKRSFGGEPIKGIVSVNVNESFIRDTLLYLIYNNLYSDINITKKSIYF